MWLSVVYVYTNTCTCKLDFTFRVSDRAHRQSKCGVMPRPRVPVMFWFRFHALHKLESMNRMLPRRALELGAMIRLDPLHIPAIVDVARRPHPLGITLSDLHIPV